MTLRSAQHRAIPNRAGEPLCCDPLVAGDLNPAQAGEMAHLFKALADPTRLRLLSIVARSPEGEICVCKLSDTFDVSAPTISHHLKVLRQCGLLAAERRGTMVYYRLVLEVLDRLGAILDTSHLHAVNDRNHPPANVSPLAAAR